MNVLAGILGVLALISLAALTGFFLWRWEAQDIEREEAMRHAQLQLTLASLELRMCAIRGHKYLPTFIDQGVRVWRCGACGECVSVSDEDGVA